MKLATLLCALGLFASQAAAQYDLRLVPEVQILAVSHSDDPAGTYYSGWESDRTDNYLGPNNTFPATHVAIRIKAMDSASPGSAAPADKQWYVVTAHITPQGSPTSDAAMAVCKWLYPSMDDLDDLIADVGEDGENDSHIGGGAMIGVSAADIAAMISAIKNSSGGSAAAQFGAPYRQTPNTDPYLNWTSGLQGTAWGDEGDVVAWSLPPVTSFNYGGPIAVYNLHALGTQLVKSQVLAYHDFPPGTEPGDEFYDQLFWYLEYELGYQISFHAVALSSNQSGPSGLGLVGDEKPKYRASTTAVLNKPPEQSNPMAWPYVSPTSWWMPTPWDHAIYMSFEGVPGNPLTAEMRFEFDQEVNNLWAWVPVEGGGLVPVPQTGPSELWETPPLFGAYGGTTFRHWAKFPQPPGAIDGTVFFTNSAMTQEIPPRFPYGTGALTVFFN